jgi:Mlc titration factor MtfA (ptsG expression regulator)
MISEGLPPRVAWLPLIGSLLIGGAVALFVALREDPPGWLALGPLVAALLYVLATRRDRRRRRLAREAFPEAWRAVLEGEVGFYRELSDREKRRFEREVRFFLDEQLVTGPRGAAIDDELRVLVAASAVVLIFGRPGYRYPRLRDVVVYEGAFDEDYEVHPSGDILGMVHAQGPILFSARSLRAGFRGEHDGHNVGYHELAHVLDFDSGRADGVPGFMPWAAVRPWVARMHTEMAKAEKGRSILRRYAATNEAELFAVATEMFFERPAQMKEKHPDLYALLRQAYGQDPAAERSS